MALSSLFNSSKKHTVIIGNGIAGVTCARHIRKKSKESITIISAETDFHFSRTALMYVFMGHMRFEDTKPYEDGFWKKNNISLLNRYVTAVDCENKLLRFANGETLGYDNLVIASGSSPNMYGWPGQNLIGVQGLYSYQDLQLLEKNTKHVKQAVVVGGGLIGIELVEMLLTKNIEVTFLVRENRFWKNVLPKEESLLIEKLIKKHHVNLITDSELDVVLGDEHGVVKSIVTKKGEIINCQFVGITVGVSPNISFLKNSGIETDKGVLVNHYFETNQKDVYAIGDCAQFKEAIEGRRPIEQVWYTGRMHGETLAQTIIGNRVAYNPGHWFNSAKFFDLEFQTYGTVPAIIDSPFECHYWEHKNNNMCMRFVYHKETRIFTGINTFGIRLRHQVFDQWLCENKTIEYVVSHLEEANFDPEFFENYFNEIKAL